jgi:four helix bundle protein
MAPRNFEELQCWQLANQLRRRVLAICRKEEVREDRRFCNSFRDASGSVCRNLSEGFTRFTSAYIVQFFNYALASLAEVKDHLIECEQREVITAEEFKELHDLAEHTKAKSLKFMRPHEERLKNAPQRKRPRRATRN